MGVPNLPNMVHCPVAAVMNRYCSAVLVLGIALWTPVNATWSIVAVDPETGEVGLAAATCNSGVQFIAGVAPGAGIVAAQAATSFKGRNAAREWMEEGVRADEILKRLSNPDFYDGWFDSEYPDLQYGVATLTNGPQAGYVGGDAIWPWSGGVAGKNYSVQGNTLRGEEVVEATAAAFEFNDDTLCAPALGERLLRALEAGRDAGGDNRCPLEWPAYSAILIVADTENELRLVAPQEIGIFQTIYYQLDPYSPDEDSIEPVRHLRQKYELAGGKQCQE